MITMVHKSKTNHEKCRKTNHNEFIYKLIIKYKKIRKLWSNFFSMSIPIDNLTWTVDTSHSAKDHDIF